LTLSGVERAQQIERLKRYRAGRIIIVVGGVIPQQDMDELRANGASAIFPPGTVIAEAAAQILDELNARLGYAQKERLAGEG
jgi:methylmalonyl-CoA mutase